MYSVDAVERQRFYMLCNLKKPAKSSIQAHVTRMETLNKHLGLLPTIKNSPQAVVSTELGNVPFNEMTLASIILNHLPVVWRTQYALTHMLVPKSPRAILVDLENIEKIFVEKANKAARANKAKVAATAKLAGEQVPRKGKRTHGGGPAKGTPKKGCTDCDNIHPWISTTGDLAFSHQQEFAVLNSQKGFWRSFPEISLF